MAIVIEQSGQQTFLQKMLHFLIIPKDDEKQALRIRRFLMAAAGYTLCIILAYVSYLAGIMEWRGVAGGLILFPVINIVLYIIFRTGLNLRMADPSLTAIQICAAVLVTMYAMYFARESRGVLLLIYVVAFLFGIFRLDTRGFLYVSVFTFVTYSIDLFLLHQFRPQGINFTMEYVQLFVFAVVLVAFSVIGGYISGMRAKLNKSLVIIKEMSIRDELTGAYNRRHIMEQLENERQRVSRGGARFALAMLDIDHFKSVNDTLGHLAGDEILRGTSDVIRNNLRSVDLYGRFGGEEFLILMTQADIKGAMLCAERIRGAVERKRFPKVGTDFKVTVSLGLTDYRGNEKIDAMIARADKALYRAKDGGRNRVEYDSGTYPEIEINDSFLKYPREEIANENEGFNS
jgi:diguanylate cyclase (GGDEF)-like protein